MKYGSKERGHEGEKSQRKFNYTAKNLIIELFERRESSYHRLDLLSNLTYSLIYGP